MLNALVAKTPIDQRVAEIVLPVIRDSGFDLVRVRVQGGKTATLQVMIDHPERAVSIDDCADMSAAISAILDVEDPLEEGYHLEVSSPGIDRPLTRLQDFEDFTGYDAKIELNQAIEGRKRFKGVLAGTHDDEILLNTEVSGALQTIGLKFDWLTDAKLVLTDELIRTMLRQKEQAGITIEHLDETAFDDIIPETSEPELNGQSKGSPISSKE